MMSAPFSIRDSIRQGLLQARQHAGFLGLAFLAYVGVTVAMQVLRMMHAGLPSMLLGNLVLIPLLVMGWQKALLDVQDGGQPRLETLWSQGSRLLPYWGVVLGFLALVLAVAIPFAAVLLVFFGLSITQLGPDTLHHPGLLIALPLAAFWLFLLLWVRFAFVGWVLVDKDLGPVQCYQRSAAISRGHGWRILGLLLTLMAFNLLGALCLLVGLVITIPSSFLALAHVYRTLDKAAGG